MTKNEEEKENEIKSLLYSKQQRLHPSLYNLIFTHSHMCICAFQISLSQPSNLNLTLLMIH